MLYYLKNAQQGLTRYQTLRDNGALEKLSEATLRQDHQPFPSNWNEAFERFRNSERMHTLLGNEHALAIAALSPGKETRNNGR